MGSKGARIITKTIDLTVTVANKINPEISNDYQIVDTVGAGDCFTAAFSPAGCRTGTGCCYCP